MRKYCFHSNKHHSPLDPSSLILCILKRLPINKRFSRVHQYLHAKAKQSQTVIRQARKVPLCQIVNSTHKKLYKSTIHLSTRIEMEQNGFSYINKYIFSLFCCCLRYPTAPRYSFICICIHLYITRAQIQSSRLIALCNHRYRTIFHPFPVGRGQGDAAATADCRSTGS